MKKPGSFVWSSSAALALGALLSAPFGCTGSVADGGGGARDGEGASNGDSVGGIGANPEVPISPSNVDCKSTARALPQARAWRLSTQQYANTVNKLFGLEIKAADLPADELSLDAQGVVEYDTDARAAQVDPRRAEAYQAIAETAATKYLEALPDSAGCIKTAKASNACLEDFLAVLGLKAFRRPLESEERARYASFYRDAAQDFGADIAANMTASVMLQSPNFLYRTELGKGQGEALTLTQYELASELSYLIADEPPSESLLRAAEEGRLEDPSYVRILATDLLASPSAKAKTERFFDIFLHVKDLAKGTLQKSDKLTAWPSVATDSHEELRRMIDDVVWNEGKGLVDLFTTRTSYINNDLAKFYGIPDANTSKDYVKAELPEGRKGILSRAGLVASISNADATSPIHRGLFFFRNLLCNPLPLPPPDALDQGALLLSPDPMATQREHWEHSRANARVCAGCHQTFQPMGLALENFDPIGTWRTSEFGRPIDPSVKIEDFEGINGSYDNGLELGAAIARSELGRTCFARQMATYAFGRSLDPEVNGCELEAIVKSVDSDMGVQDLLLALTQQPSFYLRRPSL